MKRGHVSPREQSYCLGETLTTTESDESRFVTIALSRSNESRSAHIIFHLHSRDACPTPITLSTRKIVARKCVKTRRRFGAPHCRSLPYVGASAQERAQT